jgi:hypothetical protein
VGAFDVDEVETGAAGRRRADEVVHGAGIEEGCEHAVANGDVELHRVLETNAGDGVEGDEGLLLCLWWRIVQQIGSVIDEVRHLQKEQALPLVAAHIGLITIVAEALTASLCHLSRGQAAQLAGRR